MTLELGDTLLQTGDRPLGVFLCDKRTVVAPPVQSDLLGFIDRAHQEPNSDREKLDVGQRNADVACDHQPLVENAIEDVNQVGALVRRAAWLEGHAPTVTTGLRAVRD